MILEAFSDELHNNTCRVTMRSDRPSEDVLHQWLAKILLHPPADGDHVGNVIHAEIAMVVIEGQVEFQGRSASGDRLLQSLYEYCISYENWQFSRWLHHIRASDFQVS